MKKSGLAGALAARKQLKEPEPQPEPLVQPEKTVAKKPSRFHTSVYPNPELYRNIKITLLKENQGRDFNQLVCELLQEWYDENSEA